MEWGMANRLSRTIKSDGRCFYLAGSTRRLIDERLLLGVP